jgi:hypothetical protein
MYDDTIAQKARTPLERTSKEGRFNVRYALACRDVTNRAAGFQVGFVLVTLRQAKAYRTLNRPSLLVLSSRLAFVLCN